jgi:S-formylglutathione hydrolase FrmB
VAFDGRRNGFRQHHTGWQAIHIGVALAGCALLLSLPTLAGTIVTRELGSTALGRPWSYAVYLPSGYDISNLKYPVLYLLHGNGGNLYAMKYIFRYSARPAMLQPER